MSIPVLLHLSSVLNGEYLHNLFMLQHPLALPGFLWGSRGRAGMAKLCAEKYKVLAELHRGIRATCDGPDGAGQPRALFLR